MQKKVGEYLSLLHVSSSQVSHFSHHRGYSFFLFLCCPIYPKKPLLFFFTSLARFSSSYALAFLITSLHPDFFLSNFSFYFQLALTYSCIFSFLFFSQEISSMYHTVSNPTHFLFCFIAISSLRKDRQQFCFFFFQFISYPTYPLGYESAKHP